MRADGDADRVRSAEAGQRPDENTLGEDALEKQR
jgi:hypothetical protein